MTHASNLRLSRGTHPAPSVVAMAFHEAGHAVVARRSGVVVISATILADADGLGRVRLAEDSLQAAGVDVRLLTLMAGQAAQDSAVVLGRCESCGDFDAFDVAEARVVLARQLRADDWLADSVDAGLAEWRARAFYAVWAGWTSITRVAAGLLEHKHLTAREIEERD